MLSPTLSWNQCFFGCVPVDGKEFGKGKLCFWICLYFCLLSPRVDFSNEFPFFIVMVVIMEKPPGNKCCEGSLAEKAVNIGYTPHFNIMG